MEEIEVWIARDKDNALYLYKQKPNKNIDALLWNSQEECFEIKPHLFPSVKWEDDEPTKLILSKKQTNKNIHK